MLLNHVFHVYKRTRFPALLKKNEHGHVHIAVFKMDNQQEPTV